MPRRSGLAALAAVACATMAVPAPARAPDGDGTRAAAAQAPAKLRGKRVRIRGRLGYGRVYTHPRPVPAGMRRRLDKQFSHVNPPGARQPEPASVPGPQTPPTVDDAPDGPRQTHGPHRPPPEPGDQGARSAAAPVAHAAATGDYVLFRSTKVVNGIIDGVTVTRQTAEPSVANDRNGILFTGNDFAAISGDNGITWQFLDPNVQFAASDGGFCCDQVAYAVDRGATSLIFWLLQYANDGDTTPSDGTNGRLRLVVFQSRNKLLGGADELLDQTDYCTYDFKPANFGMVDATYFDFNQMSHTKEHLYISSKALQNLGDTDGDRKLDSDYLDGVVWRIPLDELDDDDACDFDADYWSGAGTDRNPALVQGAGNLSTMYWASQDSNSTSEILVTKVADSSTVGDIFTPAITTFLQTERQSPGTAAALQAHCPTPDGSDPCLRVNDDINTGYTTPTEVGWFWNVREGPGFPFPHIRGVRFSTVAGGLARIEEPDIWSSEHAFFYPAVGVNSLYHVGLTAYRAGGPPEARKEISARAALVDNVNPGWASLSFQGLITSDSGVARNTWGDYQHVRAYGDCDKTFLGSVHSMQGGNVDANAEPRFVWFGREEHGCADLAVVALSAYTLAVEVDGEETLVLGSTTRNIGSGTAAASTTRYHLSRDAEFSDADILLDDPAAVPSLSAVEGSDTHGHLALPPVPAAASGTYYVLGCADDLKVVIEIGDANNCLVAPQTVTVTRTTKVASTTGIGPVNSVPQWSGGGGGGKPFQVEVELEFPTRQVAQRGVDVSFHLGSSGGTRGLQQIGASNITYQRAFGAQRRRPGQRRGGRRIKFRRSVRVPRGIKRRRQFLVACIGPRPRAGRCVSSRKPIYIRGVRLR